MKKLIYLLPSLELTTTLIHELKAVNIDENMTRVVGKDSHRISQQNLNEANVIHKSDLLPALKRGALIGLGLSVIACLLYDYFLPNQFNFSFAIALIITLFTTLSCAWASSLIGISVDDPMINKHKRALKKGYYLLVIEVQDVNDETSVKQVMERFEQAEFAGSQH